MAKIPARKGLLSWMVIFIWISTAMTGIRYAEGESWTLGGYAVGQNAGNESAFSVFMADVILLDNGTYRMYYGAAFQNGTAIKYAESSDGASWTVKGTVLQGASSQSDPEYLISGPSVLRLPDGRYRMYYQSAPQVTLNEKAKYHVRSAISSDGLAFTKENGVRLNINSYDSASTLRLAGHGTYFIASDGTYVGVFSGEFTSDAAGPSDLKMATSADGLTFGNLQTLYTDWHDPIVIKANGQYRIYATYLLEKQGSAVSLDGLTWPTQMSDEKFIDSSGNTLTEATSGVGDIGGVLLSTGAVRLYTNYGTTELSRDIVYFDSPLVAQNNCAASVSSSLVVHIPIVTYSESNYWADLQYNSSDSTLTLSNAAVVSDVTSYSRCVASTLSSDFKLHIPVLMISSVSYWADLQWNGSVFVVVGSGKN